MRRKQILIIFILFSTSIYVFGQVATKISGKYYSDPSNAETICKMSLNKDSTFEMVYSDDAQVYTRTGVWHFKKDTLFLKSLTTSKQSMPLKLLIFHLSNNNFCAIDPPEYWCCFSKDNKKK